MTLRFQKEDEVEREAKTRWSGAVWSIAVCYVILAALSGTYAWLSGHTLAAYEKDIEETLAIALVLGVVVWLIGPIYWEFHIRSKEIDGKVSAIEAIIVQHAGEMEKLRDKLHFRTKELYLTVSVIEEAVIASKEHHGELLEKLTAIEEKLDELSENVEPESG